MCKGNYTSVNVFHAPGGNRNARDEPLFFLDGAEARGLEKRSAHTDLGQISKGHLVKKVCMQRLRRAGARLAAGKVMYSSLTEKTYVNTK